MIVVTGATGGVGGLLARELAEHGVPQRLLVRDAARAPSLDGAEIAVADYGDPVSLAGALGEGDRVFMVSLHEPPERRVPLHRSFVEAATVSAGSCAGASAGAAWAIGRLKEKRLPLPGVDSTHTRPPCSSTRRFTR